VKRIGKTFLSALIDITEVLIIGLSIFLLTYVFAGQLLRVTGDSMTPNFLDGEQLIAEKISIKFEKLQRGEIVIFKHPTNSSRLVIKRVVALPNETINLREGKVYINGELLTENYLPESITTSPGKTLAEGIDFKVPYDSYILMGDNRISSTDSREWGPIKSNFIVGKAMLIYYPLNKIRLI
jgi:signal peptidase I